MIPKIIHFCWLSNDPYPPMIQRCIDSWKEHMPDYKIKRWSTENFDINSVRIVKEAFEEKKYAFAADYIRCYALYSEGGIYLDSDVLVNKNFDELLNADYVTGIEFHPFGMRQYKQQVDEYGHRRPNIKEVYGIGLQAAFMASIPKHSFVKQCLDYYRDISLADILNNHLLAPVIQVKEVEKYGFVYRNEKQLLSNNIVIYPTSVIGQGRDEIRGRYVAHLGAGSWVHKSLKQKIIKLTDSVGVYKLYMKLKDMLGLVSQY